MLFFHKTHTQTHNGVCCKCLKNGVSLRMVSGCTEKDKSQSPSAASLAKHQLKFLLFRKVWQELVSIPFLTTSYRILFVMHIYNQDPFPFFSSYLFGRVIEMATLYSILALLITYIFVFLISPSTSSPHTHVHISTSDFHDVKRERVKKKKQSTWLLFNVVSQAFSGL